jgi:hypothetical protein
MNAYGLDLGFGSSAGRAQQEEENEFLLSALGYSNSDGSENSQKGTGNDNNNSNDDDDNTSNTYVKNADSPLLSGLHSPVMQEEEGRSPGSGVPPFRSIAGQAAAFRHLHEQAYQARRLQSNHALFTPSEENASPAANTLETTSGAGAGAATRKTASTLSRSSSSSGPNGANIVHNHDVKSDDDKARNTESKGSGNETRNKRKMTSSRTSGGARSKNAKNKHTPSAPVGGGVQTASSSTASTVKVADGADPRRKSKYVRDKERRNQLNDALDDLHATLGIPQSARTDRVSWNG